MDGREGIMTNSDDSCCIGEKKKDRTAEIIRNTKETKIKINLNLDQYYPADIQCPIGFFGHMLDTFAKHCTIGLKIEIKGDLQVDQHHTVEDTGLVLGQAFRQALGERRGIERAGYFIFPMDDAVAVAAVDFGGRSFLNYKVSLTRQFCGEFDSDLLSEFFRAFSGEAKANVFIRSLDGQNDHHIIEGIFKAFARAVKKAIAIDPKLNGEIPSTKEALE